MMLHKTIPIDSVDIIDKNIATSVIDALCDELDIDKNFIIKSYISDEMNKNYNIGNSRGLNQKEDLIIASYRTDINDVNNSGFNIMNNRKEPILLDSNNWGILPVEIPTKMTISLEVKSKNISTINNIISKAKMRSRLNSINKMHDILFRYHFPNSIVKFITMLYNNRKEEINDVNNIEEFISKFNYKNITHISDISGNNITLNVLNNKKCIGNFEDDVFTLKPEFIKDESMYTVNLSYNIYYDKPNYLTVYYNLLIYNRIVDSVFIPKIKYVEENETFLQNVKKQITSEKYINFKRGNKYIHIPLEDIYREYTNTNGETLLSILITIDNSNTLFNLENIPLVKIEPLLIKFLKDGEYQYVGNILNSIVQLTLYENDKRIDNVLYLDNNLNVKSNYNFNKVNRYRVIISIEYDTDKLKYSAKQRLEDYLYKLKNDYLIGNKTVISKLKTYDFLKPLITSDSYMAKKYKMMKNIDYDNIFKILERDIKKGNKESWYKDNDIKNLNLDIINKVLDMVEINFNSIYKIEYDKNSIILYSNVITYIKYNNDEIILSMVKINNDYYKLYFDSIMVIYENGIFKKYKDNELIGEGNSIEEMLYSIYDLITKVNVLDKQLDNGSSFKTVMVSKVITYGLRSR